MKFEILGWWKANSNRYLLQSKMTRDVLAIPVSIVASESAFSTGGFRSSLFPLMVQNLVCAQNWSQDLDPISFHKSRDEVEALEDEFHDLGDMFNFQTFFVYLVLLNVSYLNEILSNSLHLFFFSSYKSSSRRWWKFKQKLKLKQRYLN